ncbi:hypothetical protein PS3A_08370 [Pseudomonas sp. 3A(2025)]
MTTLSDFSHIRAAMAAFDPAPRVEPNQEIDVNSAFLPKGHRNVLDLRRQLVVGNRGAGKSFWTHALLQPSLRQRLANVYGFRQLEKANVVVGFNGSVKVSATAPTVDELAFFIKQGIPAELIWRAVLTRIASVYNMSGQSFSLEDTIARLSADPQLYSHELSLLDDTLAASGSVLVIVFDALDRIQGDWKQISDITRALLILAVGLQSFTAIRAKIFMRVDQFSDQELFRFPDSSKIRNDHVNLVWRPSELYGLLLFQLLLDSQSRNPIKALAQSIQATQALPQQGVDTTDIDAQEHLINAIAGAFMGANKKRGRVYSWVPLHLSDAAQTCSPRSFLVAWKKAAEHDPAPSGKAVDHLGLQDGVRSASTSRLAELYEDYPWIQPALEALRRQFVPIEEDQLFALWEQAGVRARITSDPKPHATPVRFLSGDEPSALLSSMRDVGVMEVRKNGKINVPDIFRVEAEILRKGGVAVPKRVF